MSRVLEKYKKEIVPKLMKQFSYSSIMQVPKLEKITVSVCTGDAIQNNKILDTISKDVSAITNQKAIITKARKSISNFKLRKGMPLGCKVTLRRKNMYTFFDKLITVALPAIKDFRGVSARSFDARGNYSLGLKEYVIFPEISYDQVDKVRGMSIVISTSAKTDKEARALLENLGMPFKK